MAPISIKRPFRQSNSSELTPCAALIAFNTATTSTPPFGYSKTPLLEIQVGSPIVSVRIRSANAKRGARFIGHAMLLTIELGRPALLLDRLVGLSCPWNPTKCGDS